MNIFVSNISFKVREQALKELFEQYGEVSNVRIIKDKETRRSKGYGFVEMADDSQANAAIAALNDYELEGKPIAVKEARPRTENPAPRRSNYRDGGNYRGGDRGPRYGNRSQDDQQY